MAEEKKIKFMDPHEVPPPPGVEGWERMYSRAYLFTPKGADPERERYESERLWVFDSLHQPPLPLMVSIDFYDTTWWPRLNQMNTNVFAFPAALGLDHRMLYGYPYLSPVMVNDPEEIARREEILRKRIGYYWEHWPEALDNLRRHQMTTSKAIEDLTFEELPYIVPESDITEFKGTYAFDRLEKNWRTLVDLWNEAFSVHFEMFNIAHATHLAFSDFCRKAFPGISDASIGQMLAGMGADIYRPDEEMLAMARLALELKVAETILQPGSFSEVETRLKGTDAGRKWLDELEKRKNPWFYFTTGYSIFTPQDRSWHEDYNLPLASVRTYIERVKKGEDIEGPKKEAKERAEKLATEYRNLIKAEGDRNVFNQLLGLDKMTSPHIEGHMFWFECLHNYPVRKKLNDIGKIFVNYGYMEDPDDIWYLNIAEIEELIRDVVRCATTYGKIDWAPGRKAQSTWYWKPEIKWRKEIVQRLAEWKPPEALGVAPEVIADPFLIGLWGITTEKIALWHKAAAVKLDEITELKGFPAAPRVTEGQARILLDVSRIGDVKAGEILVCPTTSPSWGPVFNFVKAVVTDMGGMMSHSAIVSREYGIPAVTGTGYATKAIKTGDIILVDGDKGVVSIIKKTK
jgi:pyruvate,water dikinase